MAISTYVDGPQHKRRHQELCYQIYRHTGKVAVGVAYSPNTLGIHVLFEDGMEGFLTEGDSIDGIQIREKPKHFCASCGEEDHGPGTFDQLGRCHISKGRFWEKVRRLFWHRHSKGKSL